jgi:hypothetical protein
MRYLYNVEYRYIYQLKLVDIVVLSILGMTNKYKQTILFQKLLSDIYLVVVLVIALLGGGRNKYKQIQIYIKNSILTSINLTSDQIFLFGHMGLPYIKSSNSI